MTRDKHGGASLEAIVESGDLGLPILHPGGLESTRQLAELCRVAPGQLLLDVASGTGESACYLAEKFGCRVIGIDHSVHMIDTAKKKAEGRGLAIEFKLGDARDLPFEAQTFDAVISECTTCALDKPRVTSEMMRAAKRGGYVGISDLYWKEQTPERLKVKLVELENEHPETLAGWVHLFEQAGLREIQTKDLSGALATMAKEMKKELGLSGEARVLLRILTRWGVRSLPRVLASQRLFRNRYLGYAIIVGRRFA